MTTLKHQPTLYLHQSIDRAIKRIQTFCPQEGYYLCCSFGKDSIVLLELAKMAGVKFDSHFHRSTVDPPELIRFGKEKYPEVAIEKPPISMFKLILENGCPPIRRTRYCCRVFKEEKGIGRIVMTGIRANESENRQGRKVVESCRNNASIIVNPLIDWHESEVWDFIHSYGIPYSCLYDEGFSRLGCIMCPNAYYKTRLKEAARWPRFFAAYMGCFEQLAADENRTWKTSEEVMRWWLEEKKWDATSYQLFNSIMLEYRGHCDTMSAKNDKVDKECQKGNSQ